MYQSFIPCVKSSFDLNLEREWSSRSVVDSSMNITVVVFRPKTRVQNGSEINLIPDTKGHWRAETMTMFSRR